MPRPRVQTSLTLFGSPPYGFRISGGIEFNQPLVITRVTPGSLAARSGVQSGDVVIAVNNQYVQDLSQDQCEAKVRQAVGSLHMVLEKNAAKVTELPGGQVQVDGDRSIYEPNHAGTAHNRTAKGFRPGPPVAHKPGGYVPPSMSDPSQSPVFDPNALKQAATIKQGLMVMQGPGKSKVVHAQYNTPMGIYSNDNIIDTVQAQAKSVGVSLPGAQDESAYQPDVNSAVYKAVHRADIRPQRQHQSRSFKILSEIVQDE
uniref:PDZ and LIM domain protein 3-like isoform X2 n=1 Tax=Styela clava TaxID=7725 RepID=UPI001939479A|nr:PDZ and LIM domain protein 3-like isoform X2 [Styela clava]